MKHLKHIFLIAMVCMLGACNTNTDKGTPLPDDIVYDFATFESATDDGSVFSLRKANDSQLAQYYCSYSLKGNDDIKPGQRVLIAYTCIGHEPYTTGEIHLYGVRLLNQTEQDVIEGGSTDYSQWMSSDVEMQIITRTGQYINMQALIYGTNNVQLKQMILVADIATLDHPYPTLHLIVDTSNKGENPFTAYASFDISSVWDRETIKGVNIQYQTPSGIQGTQFNKPQTGIMPVE